MRQSSSAHIQLAPQRALLSRVLVGHYHHRCPRRRRKDYFRLLADRNFSIVFSFKFYMQNLRLGLGTISPGFSAQLLLSKRRLLSAQGLRVCVRLFVSRNKERLGFSVFSVEERTLTARRLAQVKHSF